MRRAKSRRAEERPEQSRAMGHANELFRRKEKSTRRISLTFFLLFFFKGVVVVVDFFAFFSPKLIWVHKLKLSRVSRKERFLRDIKFKHFGIPKDIHHVNAERCS